MEIKQRILRDILYAQVPVNTRFYGKSLIGMYGKDYQESVKTETGARVINTNQVYFPSEFATVLIFKDVNINIHSKIDNMSDTTTTGVAAPAKAADSKKKGAKKVAPKKAAKKAAKKGTAKPAPKKTATKREGPTKKEVVAKYLKAGKKPAEILELMEKEHKMKSTLASVRAFVQTINNGG